MKNVFHVADDIDICEYAFYAILILVNKNQRQFMNLEIRVSENVND